MISEKMAKELNNQIREELYSAYLYLSMSAHAQAIGMPGVTQWFTVQTQEETAHAQRFYQYIQSQGARVILQAIDQPPAEFKSAKTMFEASLKHERHITERINFLSDLAVKEKDHATQIFLQWFVTEQVEEEEGVKAVIDQLKIAGDHGGGLFMIDRELGQRVYTPPAAAGGK